MKTFEDQWELLRKKGKAKFIFKFGILLWGIPMATFAILYLHLRGGIPWTPTVYYTTPSFLILGLIFSFLFWKFLENRYNKLK
ncbi:MAG: hypothetical protein ACSHX6_15270 [Akkermansiaceae bacterium]